MVAAIRAPPTGGPSSLTALAAHPRETRTETYDAPYLANPSSSRSYASAACRRRSAATTA